MDQTILELIDRGCSVTIAGKPMAGVKSVSVRIERTDGGYAERCVVLEELARSRPEVGIAVALIEGAWQDLNRPNTE